jgi:hypothetical protein
VCLGRSTWSATRLVLTTGNAYVHVVARLLSGLQLSNVVKLSCLPEKSTPVQNESTNQSAQSTSGRRPTDSSVNSRQSPCQPNLCHSNRSGNRASGECVARADRIVHHQTAVSTNRTCGCGQRATRFIKGKFDSKVWSGMLSGSVDTSRRHGVCAHCGPLGSRKFAIE